MTNPTSFCFEYELKNSNFLVLLFHRKCWRGPTINRVYDNFIKYLVQGSTLLIVETFGNQAFLVRKKIVKYI